ncbi:MAG: helix-turn-helix domain-containing protein [SAR324 cluster bacterium]|nr:helix-turn-helix domain-containing protein [SAR324 cluster bacterium]
MVANPFPKTGTDFSILRHLRKNTGMTIEQLAEKTGVSFAVISKLERNMSNPSLDTLRSLAAGLGLSTAQLISLVEPVQAVVKQSKSHTTGDFIFDLTELNGLVISIGHAKKGSMLFHPERNTKEREICSVLNGMIKISYFNQIHILKKGDSIQFDAFFNHSYEVLEDCEILLIHFANKESYG